LLRQRGIAIAAHWQSGVSDFTWRWGLSLSRCLLGEAAEKIRAAASSQSNLHLPLLDLLDLLALLALHQLCMEGLDGLRAAASASDCDSA